MKRFLIDDFPQRSHAVTTRNLGVRFAGKTALADLALSVPEGAAFVLAGANGAGKTTLLRILMDLVMPETGQALVSGLDCGVHGARVRARIGYLPEQTRFPHGWMTVARLWAHHRVYYPGWDKAYAARLAAALDIDPTSRYSGLSKGQARRVQLVMALAPKPPLLLLDEPTDGLDPLARECVLSLLASHLDEAPTTLVIATHVLQEVEGLGDTLAVLRGGRLVAQLDREMISGRLFHYRLQTTSPWSPPPALAERVLHKRERGRETLAAVWGPPEEITAALAEVGLRCSDPEPLTLGAATRILLGMEVP